MASDFRQLLLLQYLDSKGTQGGYKADFRYSMEDRLPELMSHYSDKMKDVLLDYVVGIWHDGLPRVDIENKQLPLFAQTPPPAIIRFPDASVPGNYRTVLAVHANIAHWEWSLRDKRENLIRTENALEAEESTFKLALKRAKGNRQALLIHLGDDLFQARRPGGEDRPHA